VDLMAESHIDIEPPTSVGSGGQLRTAYGDAPERHIDSYLPNSGGYGGHPRAPDGEVLEAAETLNDFALIAQLKGRFQKAEVMLARALRIGEGLGVRPPGPRTDFDEPCPSTTAAR
jgi:hypothetical protein